MAELFYDELSRVQDHLNGHCPADEQTLSAVAVLADRLEQLRKQSSLFAAVSLSPKLQRLMRQTAFSVVG
jgi:hypothetical protein